MPISTCCIRSGRCRRRSGCSGGIEPTRAISGSRRSARSPAASSCSASCSTLTNLSSSRARSFRCSRRGALRWRRILGANRLRVFLERGDPPARPAIAVGVSLALMEALNDIGASEFLGIRTLTVAIYTTWTVRMSVEGAAQIALVMLAVVSPWSSSNAGAVFSGMTAAARYHTPTPQCSAAVAVLPPPRSPASCRSSASSFRRAILVLASWRHQVVTFRRRAPRVDLEQRHVGRDRDAFVAIVASLVLVSGIPCACRAIALAPALARIASIGYAVPGTVLVVGLLVPLASFDNAVDAMMRSAFGIRTGLLLTGLPGRGAGARLCAALPRHLDWRDRGRPVGEGQPAFDMAARSLGSRLAEDPWRGSTCP